MKKRTAILAALALLLNGCGIVETAPAITDSTAAITETASDEQTETVTEAAAESETSAATVSVSEVTTEAVSAQAVNVSTATAGDRQDTATSVVSASTPASAVSAVPASDDTAVNGKSELENSKTLFDNALNGVSTQIRSGNIVQTGQVHGQDYSLTIRLDKWDHLTSIDQMVVLSELFWECYPRMYERFHDISDPPTDVILAIEDEGYEIAEMYGNFIHLHDNWLHENTGDYDCITHELAHVIQCDWDADYLEYSDYIERFADCCRYEYAMQDGRFNDSGWTLQTAYDENTRERSVRFLVWLDYFYSDNSTDIIRNYFRVCHDQFYSADNWNEAWQEIFAGTALAGKTIDEVWEMYTGSDFAYLSSYADNGGTSELLSRYNIRAKRR